MHSQIHVDTLDFGPLLSQELKLNLTLKLDALLTLYWNDKIYDLVRQSSILEYL